MFEIVNEVAIIGTTFFMMASATVWFSPLMFGKQWLDSIKVTEEEIEESKEDLVKNLIVSFVTYAAGLTVLALMVFYTEVLGLALAKVIVSISVLLVSILGIVAIWGERSKENFLIGAGFCVYFIVTGMLLINYWPW